MLDLHELKVLIACERTGTIREAFKKYGVAAVSSDLQPTISPGSHYTGNVLDILHNNWDLIIAHPPCYRLCNAAEYLKSKHYKEHHEAITFFLQLFYTAAPFACNENPAGTMNKIWRKPSQIIHPYMFGSSDKKQTCLWLRGLPKLIHTNNVRPGKSRLANLGSCPGRRDLRSVTYPGIAQAMAKQWLAYFSMIGYIKPVNFSTQLQATMFPT